MAENTSTQRRPDVVRYVIVHEQMGWETRDAAKTRFPNMSIVAFQFDSETSKLKIIDLGDRQGHDPVFIRGNSSASKSSAHMPITFEGEEPEEPTPFDLIMAGARWVLLGLAFFCTLMVAAGYYRA